MAGICRAAVRHRSAVPGGPLSSSVGARGLFPTYGKNVRLPTVGETLPRPPAGVQLRHRHSFARADRCRRAEQAIAPGSQVISDGLGGGEPSIR